MSIAQDIKDSISIKEALLKNQVIAIDKIANVITEALRNGNRVYIFGNGGSAADSQHFAAELAGRYMKDRDPLPAVALTTDTSTMTAIANDYGYAQVFSRQILAHAETGDVVIGISTSGNSVNVNNGLITAKGLFCTTIGLLGKGGGDMGNYCDMAIDVGDFSTPRIQEAHELIIHIICGIVENNLFPDE